MRGSKADLPEDAALPGLEAIRTVGLAATTPALDLDGGSVEVLLRGYRPGSRATLEARAGRCHYAIQSYRHDMAVPAVYEALAAGGLAAGQEVRVPRLVIRDDALKLLVVSWLDGPATDDQLKNGQAARAGELASRWVRLAHCLPVGLGAPLGTARVLDEMCRWVNILDAADAALGAAATTVADLLAQTTSEGTEGPVHGFFYARRVVDLGDAAGVIGWDYAGHGPLEMDAGWFLAYVTRHGLLHEAPPEEAAAARQAFLSGIGGFLDERALAWHEAAGLVWLAEQQLRRSRSDRVHRAAVLLREAARLARSQEKETGA